MLIIGWSRLSNGRYQLSANRPIIGRYRISAGNRCTSSKVISQKWSIWMYYAPDRQLTRSVLKFNRRDVKVLVGLLTGHITLNRHLSVTKLHNDPLCPACGQEEETTYHFLATCPAQMQDRYSIFGSHLLRNEELRKVQPISLIRFARTTKRLMWPAVTSGLRIGPSRYGLSAGRCNNLPTLKVRLGKVRMYYAAVIRSTDMAPIYRTCPCVLNDWVMSSWVRQPLAFTFSPQVKTLEVESTDLEDHVHEQSQPVLARVFAGNVGGGQVEQVRPGLGADRVH